MEYPCVHEISSARSRYEIEEFFTDSESVAPLNRKEPNYEDEGPKLYEQNVELCKQIIEQLDDLDENDAGKR